MIRKTLAVGIILLLIGVNATGSFVKDIVIKDTSSLNIDGNTLYVDDDFNESTPGWNITHFARITNAINAADNNDKIIVYSGTYREVVNINKKLHLQGMRKNGGQPIIKGESWRTDVYIIADECIFENITYTKVLYSNEIGLSTSVGLQVESNNNTIRNCISRNNGIGILLNSSWNNTIYDNNIHTAGKGIRLTGGSCYNYIFNNNIHDLAEHVFQIGGSSHYNLIVNNTVSSCGSGNGFLIHGNHGNILIGNIISSNNIYGLQAKSSKNLTLYNNTFINNGIKIEGNITHFSSHVIENNYVDGKPIYYYVNQNNFLVPSDGGQVILYECSDVIIQGLNITNTDYGIFAQYCKQLQIKDNSISGTRWEDGIYISQSTDVTISNNIVSKCNKGIYVTSSEDVMIIENSVKNINTEGIRIVSSPYSLIKKNTISDCETGISTSINNCIVSENSITLCYGGISTDNKNNTVSENVIKYSGVGISISSEDSHFWGNIIKFNLLGLVATKSNNLIEDNNFLFNGLNARFEECENTWNHNYWDRPRVLPKIVRGFYTVVFFPGPWGGIVIRIPLRDFDMNPRQIPYNGIL